MSFKYMVVLNQSRNRFIIAKQASLLGFQRRRKTGSSVPSKAPNVKNFLLHVNFH